MSVTQSNIENQKSKISLIVAMAENRVIGRGNTLPWHLPADLKHFKRLTTGHTIIMGRKTFQSVGKPLPQRRNIVVTRNEEFRAQGVEVAHSLQAALDMAAAEPEVFVIGGQRLYEAALPVAHRIYLTLIHARIEGDAYFPQVDASRWELTGEQTHPADEKHAHAMSFRVYERRDE